MTVLYVDDDPDDADIFIEAMKEILPSSRCVVAETGMDALNKISKECPAFIFMELQLPFMSGLDTLREISAHPCFHKTKVVIYSSLTSETQIHACRALGAYDHMTKSSRFSVLCEDLKAVLGLNKTGLQN